MTEERRKRVVRALVVIGAYPMMRDHEVLAFHVRYFGIPECVTDVKLATVRRDLRYLLADGYVERVGRDGWAPTEAGRRWADA